MTACFGTIGVLVGRDAFGATPIVPWLLACCLAAGLLALVAVEDAVRLVPVPPGANTALARVGVLIVAGVPAVVSITRWWLLRASLPTWTPIVIAAVGAAIFVALTWLSRRFYRDSLDGLAWLLSTSGMCLGLLWTHDTTGILVAVRPGTEALHIALLVATWLGASALSLPFAMRLSRRLPDTAPAPTRIIACATVATGLVLLEADRRLFVDLYEAIHIWLGAMGIVALDTGLHLLLRPFKGWWLGALGTVAGASMAGLAGALILQAGSLQDVATRTQLSETALGASLVQIVPIAKTRPGDAGSETARRLNYDQYLAEESPLHRPNLVLISIDTVRADAVLGRGEANARMPNLQRLANESLNFRNTWAQGPLTPMGMGTLMVGRWPTNVDWHLWFWKRGRFADPEAMTPAELAKHKGRFVYTSLPRFERALAVRLHDAGYATAATAYTPGDFFRPGVGFDKGFDSFNDLTRVDWKWPTSRRIVDLGLEQLVGLKRPWFLWIHLYDPHENKRVASTYDELLRHTDDALGHLREQLEAQGVFEQAVVAVVSDHGEAFGEHRHGGHGTSLFEEQTRIPMILKVPGVEPRDVLFNAAAIDLTATFAVAGGARTEKLDGVNLLPLAFEERYPADRPIFSACHRYTDRKGGRTRDLHAVVLGSHKLIQDKKRGTVALYDLAADPKEAKNIAAKEPAITSKLQQLLDDLESGPDARPLPE